jgi:hypothetical protein
VQLDRDEMGLVRQMLAEGAEEMTNAFAKIDNGDGRISHAETLEALAAVEAQKALQDSMVDDEETSAAAYSAYLEQADALFANGPRVSMGAMKIDDRDLREVQVARCHANTLMYTRTHSRTHSQTHPRAYTLTHATLLTRARSRDVRKVQDALSATMRRLNRITAWIMQSPTEKLVKRNVSQLLERPPASLPPPSRSSPVLIVLSGSSPCLSALYCIHGHGDSVPRRSLLPSHVCTLNATDYRRGAPHSR